MCKWVSVKDRLPDIGEHVIVTNGGFVCESFLDRFQKWQRGGVDMFFMTPTHWTPFPDPPHIKTRRTRLIRKFFSFSNKLKCILWRT